VISSEAMLTPPLMMMSFYAAGDVDVALVVGAARDRRCESRPEDRHELVRPLPVGRGELPPADDHLAFLAGRKLMAGVVEDLHAHVEGRASDRAQLAVPGMIAAHEACLGAAGELYDRNAIRLFELEVLVDRERRGARRHERSSREIRLGHRDRLREQHVDDGRDPDGDRDAVVAEPLEEARLRELACEDERGAGQHGRPD